jgi:hypothetical protein
MVSHVRGCDSMAGGARRFTGRGVTGISCGSIRSERSRARGADAHRSSRPSASCLDRASWPVVEGVALFE